MWTRRRTADYSQLPKADVILVTHIGQAHYDSETVKLLSKDKTALLVCPLCSIDLPTGTIMINDETKTVAGLKLEAVPAYEVKGRFGVFRSIKGAANGYVITFGDKRVYVGGETENVPEVKALKQIEAAFLPVIRTMPPKDFADTVKAMQPKIVFPYAYGTTIEDLAALLKDTRASTSASATEITVAHHERSAALRSVVRDSGRSPDVCLILIKIVGAMMFTWIPPMSITWRCQ
jgi:L-ascorbate metabolism protein UlaG (beta-lactamase superfamily)